MKNRYVLLFLIVFTLLFKINVYAENITGTMYTLPSNDVNEILSINVYQG